MAQTSDALKIIKKMIKDDPQMQEMVEEASLNARVAQIIYEARKIAGLTQRQLADAVGSTQSVIARLEDADYEGHSLSMLARIATALNRKLEIDMPPKEITKS
jgi:ribosome-binding protein aMBF1 (putative translation factor)